MLLFEDDIFIGGEFAARVAALTLPDDWGMFYFGGLHMTVPQLISPGLVQTKHPRICDKRAGD